MVQTVNITGTVTDSVTGVSTPLTGTITIKTPAAPPVIQSVVVNPSSAVAGTKRTITITATGANPLKYTCLVGGTPASPVAGQPNQFTVVV